jgi:hypothetical protein
MQRRKLLRSVGGIAALTSTALLAGCSGDDESDEAEDDDEEEGDDNTTGDGQPAGGADLAGGLDSGGGDSEAPSAVFEIEYTEGEPIAESSADGYVEIAHTSGDTIPAESLVVQGTGVYPRGDGRWPNQYVDVDGTTDETVEDVTAGFRIVVDVDSDFEVQVVWNPPQEVSSTVLSEQTGPDA